MPPFHSLNPFLPPLTFKTRISLLFGFFSTLIIVLTGAAFTFGYYLLAEHDLKAFIKLKAGEIARENIVYQNGEILYRRGEEGETISVRLRTSDVSALILDQDLNRLGVYGVYRLKSEQDFESVVTAQSLKKILDGGGPVYSHASILPGRQYEVYTTPLTYQGRRVGIIQIAKEIDSLNRILDLSFDTLLTILPLSIFLSIVSGYYVTKSSFKPLLSLIEYLEKQGPNLSPRRIEIAGSPADEVVKLSHSFNRLFDRINEGIRKQKAFISNASHELKTPLTKAVSSLELAEFSLKEGDVYEAGREVVRVKGDLLGMGRILESLLLLSKISDQAPLNLPQEALSLRSEGLAVLSQLKGRIKEKKLTIKFTGGDYPVGFFREYLKIILSNLLLNAVKYCREGGRIKIEQARDSTGVSLKVSDNGIGMSGEDLERVFDRFYRSRAAVAKDQGSGLGLSIVKAICDLTGLNVSVSSLLNQGTTVIISSFIPAGRR